MDQLDKLLDEYRKSVEAVTAATIGYQETAERTAANPEPAFHRLMLGCIDQLKGYEDQARLAITNLLKQGQS